MKHFFPIFYNKSQPLLTACLLVCCFNIFCQSPNTTIANDTAATLISNQFSFTEGPAADKQGNVFFTDQPNNKIWKYDVAGKLTVFVDSAGRSNGTYFDQEGNLITCADEKNQLWRITPKGEKSVLLSDFNKHRFNGPNDLWIDHKDGIYFTDPYFQRDYWQRKSPDPDIKGEKLYYLPKGKTEAIIVDADLKKPNGIVGQDGKYLFVSDMGVGKIFRYTINMDGTLSNRHPFVSDLADGMTLDNRGDLYLAGRGITVYDSSGRKIQHFNIPSPWTANVCFGGPGKNLLFITASESVYLLKMKVRGIE